MATPQPPDGFGEECAGKEEAQKRADRIHAFRDEMDEVERKQVIHLSEDQRGKLADYHNRLLADFARRFDVDTTNSQKQLTLGLRIVTFLGAAAISAAVFFFFYRYWGVFNTAAQVAILVALPILCTLGTEFAARKEKTLYFAALAGLVAFTAFVLNLSMLGQIFNITPSQNAFLVWAAFAFILAYTYGLRILLVAGIVALSGYLAATAARWSGCYWLNFVERPENFIVSGILLFAVSFIPHRKYEEFPFCYRILGLLQAMISILILSNWGNGSYFAIKPEMVEQIYQTVGFVVSSLLIWLGIRQPWSGVMNLGSMFFTIFLYIKFYDWYWESVPRYLFFLIVGLVAVAVLIILKWLRILNRRSAL